MLVNVAARDIRVGMFVAELDRPWSETPFLLQGFLVEDQEQVAQLQSLCRFVFVDRSRSAAGVLPESGDPTPRPRAPLPHGPRTGTSSVHAKEQTPRPRPTIPPGPKKRITPAPAAASGGARKMSDAEALILDVIEELGPRARMEPEPVSVPSEYVGPGMLESLMDGIGGLFRKRERFRSPQRGAAPPETRPKAADSAPRPPVHHEFIPPSIRVAFHPETKAIDEEMPQARQAFARIEEISRQLVEDIRAGRLFSVEELDSVIDDVVDSALRSPDALMLVTRLKHQDVATYGHSLQVSVYLVAFGRHLGLPKEDLARLATLGLFLDLGKTKVPHELLSRPGPLSPDEFEVVKQHVSHGTELIRNIPDLHATILEGVAQHHEREDGSGYPAGLRAEGISLYGRMAAIVDTYVAMTNLRPHAAPITAYEALRKLSELGGRLFNASMVEQFVQTVGVFPVGSRVELSSGEIAIVLQQSTVRRLKPKVLVVTGPDKVPLQVPATLDLLYQGAGEESVHIARGLPAGTHGPK